ncbi:MAG TPA: hypothetical protein VIG76_14985 [Amnibacterium sp.]|jgi:hypothetical protein
MSDPRSSDQTDDEQQAETLPDGSGPASNTGGDTGDDDQFQG